MTQIVDVIEAAIPLLGLMLTGYLCARLRPKTFPLKALFHLNSFVFLLGIPSLMFRALASRDLDELSWRFVLGYMLLRTIFGIFSVLPFLCYHSEDKIGDYLLHLISSTWINTVIFGIPMLRSLYGPRVLILNVLAAISSVIFQMPIMLLLFEYRRATSAIHISNGDIESKSAPTREDDKQYSLENGMDNHSRHNNSSNGDETELSSYRINPKNYATVSTIVPRENDEGINARNSGNEESGAYNTDIDAEVSATRLSPSQSYLLAIQSNQDNTIPLSCNGANEHSQEYRTSCDHIKNQQTATWKSIFRSVFLKLICNHPFVCICFGLLWSLIFRMGFEQAKLPKILNDFTEYFANCVTPVASFCIGMFVHGHLKGMFAVWKQILIYLAAKMILMPIVAMLVCVVVHLDGIEARSAVLLASLPVALAGFALTTTYMADRQQAMTLMSGVIITGSILMPFVFAAWNEILIVGKIFGDIPKGTVYTG